LLVVDFATESQSESSNSGRRCQTQHAQKCREVSGVRGPCRLQTIFEQQPGWHLHFYFLAEEGLAAFLTTNNSDVKSRMAAAAVATKAEVAAGEKCEVIDS